jgi:hypothetical protein
MVYFQNKNPYLGKKILGAYNGRGLFILWPFGTCILQPFGIVYGHLVYFLVIWGFPCFGMFSLKNLAALVFGRRVTGKRKLLAT